MTSVLKLSHSLVKKSNKILLNALCSYSSHYKYADFKAVNEPILDFQPNSSERKALQESLNRFLNQKPSNDGALFDVPIVIGDREIRTKNFRYQHVPFDHSIKLAKFYHADKNIIQEAIENNLSVRAAWESSPVDFRAEILLKAADKLSNAKRADILAATMLGQGKTVYQAGNF